jgi:transposase
MKFSNKDKLRIVKEHLEQGLTLKELRDRYHLDFAKMKYVIALYRKHGESVFVNRDRRKYTREFKLDAIHRYLQGKESYYELGVDLGMINPGIIKDWVDKYKAEGEASIKTTNGRKSYLKHEDRLDKVADESLKKRLEYLEAENAYLKKLYSLIQKRSRREKKKSKPSVN